tara:strand:+ start:265 stop:588 length:324 start_codon:yes stop_codon:yes gene_type:complete
MKPKNSNKKGFVVFSPLLLVVVLLILAAVFFRGVNINISTPSEQRNIKPFFAEGNPPCETSGECGMKEACVYASQDDDTGFCVEYNREGCVILKNPNGEFETLCRGV